MNLLVTGTRYGRRDVEWWLDKWLAEFNTPGLVVLGDARGVDTQALAWAKKNGLPHRVHLAEKDVYGGWNGPLRNKEMVSACKRGDWALAFPAAHGESRGTLHCYGLALRARLHAIKLPLVPPDEFDMWDVRFFTEERQLPAYVHRTTRKTP